MKPIPFALNRNDSRPLVDQLTDELRRAIETGYWQAGESLPSRDVFAQELGVSVIVPRKAFRKLAAEGYVQPRPRLGCVVMARKGRAWRGDVLIAQRKSDGAYYITRLYDEIQSGLLAEGYMVTRAVIENSGSDRVARQHVEDLLSRRYDLVLADTPSPLVRELTSRFGSPLVSLAFDVCPRGRGPVVLINRAGAFPALAEHCRRSGIERVDVVTFGSVWRRGLRAALAAERIAAVSHAGDLEGELSLSEIERLGYELTRQALASPRHPQLLLYADDYLARGGFVALAEAGAEMPVVAWTNRGFVPFRSQPYSQLVMDPLADAERIVRHLTGLITGKARKHMLEISPRFKSWESTATGDRA